MPTSRKSSKRSSTKQNNNTSTNYNPTSTNKTEGKTEGKTHGAHINGLIFTVLIQGLILYYLYNLEGTECNCIRDWRHNYIKYFAIFLIAYSAINITIVNMPRALITIGMTITIFQLINLYAFFTYVGDLNETKCACAVEKQPLLNSTMNVLRWIQFITFVIIIVVIIWLLLFMRKMIKNLVGVGK